jgi:hypothetical protein
VLAIRKASALGATRRSSDPGDAAARRGRQHRRMWWRPNRSDWWMGVLFAIGSTCFAVASFISQWASAPRPGLGVTFFVGSIFFTSAAFVQLRASETRTDQIASLIQFAGTLFFNVSTFAAMDTSLDAKQADLRVWTPDVFGSICFLVSSWLAYKVLTRPSIEWRMAALNLVGSIFFGVSAAAALIEPSTSEPVSAAVANAGTTAGAVCFFAGALPLMQGGTTHVDPPAPAVSA